MPCRTDHMEPSAAESESKRVAQLIVYVDACLADHPAQWILAAAASDYGDASNVDKLTALLCETLRGLNDDQKEIIIYNGRNRHARALADWWDKHQVDDVRHEQEDAELNEILSRSEVRDLTGDGTGVIVELDWYKRAIKVLEPLAEFFE